MPLYEYVCDDHGHRFEVIQKFSDPPIEVCPTCGGRVHKAISSPAFQFKGSGWYVTDYARKESGGGKTEGESGDKGKPKESKESQQSKDPSTPDKDSSATKTDSTTTTDTPKSST